MNKYHETVSETKIEGFKDDFELVCNYIRSNLDNGGY